MDLKQFRRQYMSLVPQLHQAHQLVKDKLSDLPPSDFDLETGLKTYPSIKRKILSDHVRQPADLSDLVRGRLFFSEQYQFPEVLRIIQEVLGQHIKQVQQKNSSQHGLEYHGIMHIDLEINGIKFELQILPSEFRPHIELLHKAYETLRDAKSRDKLTEEEQSFLKKTHNKLHRSISQKAKENRS